MVSRNWMALLGDNGIRGIFGVLRVDLQMSQLQETTDLSWCKSKRMVLAKR